MFRLSYAVFVLLSLSFPSLSEASRIGAQSRSFRSRRAASNTTDVDNKKWTLTDDFQGESFLE